MLNSERTVRLKNYARSIKSELDETKVSISISTNHLGKRMKWIKRKLLRATVCILNSRHHITNGYLIHEIYPHDVFREFFFATEICIKYFCRISRSPVLPKGVICFRKHDNKCDGNLILEVCNEIACTEVLHEKNTSFQSITKGDLFLGRLHYDLQTISDE